MKTLGVQTNQGWRIFTLAAQKVKSPHLSVIKYQILPATRMMFPIVERKGTQQAHGLGGSCVFSLPVQIESNAKVVDLPKVNAAIICSQLPAWNPFRLKSAGPEAQTGPAMYNPEMSNHFTGVRLKWVFKQSRQQTTKLSLLFFLE